MSCPAVSNAPRCAFWNISYGLLGRSVGLATRELKAEARKRQAAPIIYADSLPIGLKNEVADKNRRRFVDASLVHQHITRIFDYLPLLDRVDIVLASGLSGDVFKTSVTGIRELCKASGKEYAELPFFYGTNTPKIKDAVTDDLNNLIRHVMERFLATRGS